jgi:hypothetical protein
MPELEKETSDRIALEKAATEKLKIKLKLVKSD